MNNRRPTYRNAAGPAEGRRGGVRRAPRQQVHRRKAASPSRAAGASLSVAGGSPAPHSRTRLLALCALAAMLVAVAIGVACWPQPTATTASTPLIDTIAQAIPVTEDTPSLVEVAADEHNRCLEQGDLAAEAPISRRYAGLADGDSWSAAFVLYCAYQLGLDDNGTTPHAVSVAEFLQHYADNPSAGTVLANDGDAQPQPGDILVLNQGEFAAAGSQRLAIVERYDAAAKVAYTIEGDVNGGVAYLARPLATGVGCIVQLSIPTFTAAPLDDGQVIAIPEGLGSIDTFEGWALITDPTSPEYELRADAGERYDAEGFGQVAGCYVVAVRPLYGSVGDYVTFTFADGSAINCIIGDVKGNDGLGVNEWGFQGGVNILEFVVSTGSWYGTGHDNPGTASCHPEWAQDIVSATNTGNYWGL